MMHVALVLGCWAVIETAGPPLQSREVDGPARLGWFLVSLCAWVALFAVTVHAGWLVAHGTP